MRSTVFCVTLAAALLVAGGAAAVERAPRQVAELGVNHAFGRMGFLPPNINYRLICNVNAWGWNQYGVWGYYRAPRVCPQ